jgi:hypothetical protein
MAVDWTAPPGYTYVVPSGVEAVALRVSVLGRLYVRGALAAESVDVGGTLDVEGQLDIY